MSDVPKITLHPTGTLVTVEYQGRITADGMRAHVFEVDALTSKVKPGFSVLTDLTELEFMELDCAPVLSHVMDQLNSMGVKRIVRVIPDPQKDIGLGILSIFHYKSAVAVHTVATREEAAHLLD